MIRVPRKPCWPFVLNRASDQAQGLVGWWPGGPSGGPRLFDMSGLGNHGTITGTVPAGGIWTPGKDGGKGALKFDGSTNYVSTTKTTGLTSVRSSIAIWAQITTVNAYQAIFSYLSTLEIFVNNANGQMVHFGGVSAFTSVGSITAGSLYHIVLVYGSSASNFFLNGRPNGTSGTSTSAVGLSPYLGARSTLANKFTGTIEDARSYNRALTAAEVWSLYDCSTRWQLRWQPGRKAFSFGAVAAATSINAGMQHGGRMGGVKSGILTGGRM